MCRGDDHDGGGGATPVQLAQAVENYDRAE